MIVHELAHQWVGDDLALEAWQHIWLNEGFATYMEWLWSEDGGGDTAQEIFDFYAGFSEDDPFWDLEIGDPGPENLFHGAVYDRGAMTLHALRLEIGDEDFFRLLRRWTAQQSGGNVRTDEFIALAERVSGEQLDAFFTTWLFTPEKPASLGDVAALRTASRVGPEKLLARPVCAGSPGGVSDPGGHATPRAPRVMPGRSARCRRARPPHCRPTGPASLRAGSAIRRARPSGRSAWRTV